MSNKIEIDTLESLSANDATATLKINNNFKKIRDELNNTLSRDGKTPNFMDADLDLNSHKIINSADPEDDKDLVTLKYLKQEIGDAKRFAEEAEASANRSAEAAADSKEAEKSAIQYAIGFPEEPVNHSAKWWAEHPDLSVVPSREEFEALEDTVQMHDSDIHQLEQDKQDKLVAGEGIAINGNVISNTQTSAEWGKIVGDITEQADLQEAFDNIVSRGTINKNDGSTFYDWIGTLQEYTEQRVQELHPDWLVYITDDTVAGSFTYTKEAIDEKLLNKQDELVSGTNIKTINNESVLGNGNISITTDTSDCVHKTGNETISGVKTFSGNSTTIKIHNTSTTGSISSDIDFEDRNNTLIGRVGCSRESNGSVLMYVGPYLNGWANIGVRQYTDGTYRAFAPTPSDSSNTNDIATTEWSNKRIKLVSVLPAVPSDNVLYVIPE